MTKISAGKTVWEKIDSSVAPSVTSASRAGTTTEIADDTEGSDRAAPDGEAADPADQQYQRTTARQGNPAAAASTRGAERGRLPWP